MPPPPPPANVYPCLDWVPQGVARRKPEKLRLTNDELRTVIASAKARALEARRRLGQLVDRENSAIVGNPGALNHESISQMMTDSSSNDRPASSNAPTTLPDPNNEDDIIMKEYGLDGYDDEDEDGTNNIENNNQTNEESENDDPNDSSTRGATRGLASEFAGLTYHASNDEDPYLRQGGGNDDDDENDEDAIIKPSDNLIVVGHVHKDESSIEVWVYDNESDSFYLHHDIIQSDYPCCVRWIGHIRNQTKNLAAAGYMSPEINIWDLDVIDVLEPTEVLSGHTDAVIDICWNEKVKSVIASGSADKNIRIWDLNECKSISNIKLSGKVSALEFGIYEQFLLLAGDLNRNVSVIDTRTRTVTNKWKLAGEVERVRWIPGDHSKFLVSDDQGIVYCFDTRYQGDNQPLVKFQAHDISVTGLEFSPKCEDMLVTASADDTVKVWDTSPMLRGSSKNTTGIEPTLIKEITEIRVGNILSLRMCPNSLARIAVGGDSKCNSFTTYDLTNEEEGKFPLN